MKDNSNSKLQIPKPEKSPHRRIPASDFRILLWDIDGTLMRSVRHGEYKKYFSATMKRVYGSCGRLEDLMPSGMTDTQIMFESLRDEGFTPEMILAEKENLLSVFKEEMSRFVESVEESYFVLEGVREILAETEKNPQFVNSLLTGNLSVAAEIKLKSVGLWHFFENSINAFGEISHDRRELVKELGRLFDEFYDFDFQQRQFIVIGDTPNDIAAARAFGAKCVAVATGKNFNREELESFQPDVVVDNLNDPQKVIELFQSL